MPGGKYIENLKLIIEHDKDVTVIVGSVTRQRNTVVNTIMTDTTDFTIKSVKEGKVVEVLQKVLGNKKQ